MKKIKYGLYYKDRLYVWINRELYRYPGEYNNKYLGLKKITCKQTWNTTYYRLSGDWVSQNELKQLTVSVQVEPVNFDIKDNDLPF